MTRIARSALCLLLSLAGAAACDVDFSSLQAKDSDSLPQLPAPEGESPDKGFPADRGANDLQALPSPSGAYPHQASERAECLAKCAQGGLSDEDQGTCRLACGHELSDEQAAARQYVDCHRECQHPEATAHCETTCRDRFVSVLSEAQTLDASCSSTCFGALNRCEEGCVAESGPRDTQATCALHCETEGTRCLKDCPRADKPAP